MLLKSSYVDRIKNVPSENFQNSVFLKPFHNLLTKNCKNKTARKNRAKASNKDFE